MSEELVKALNDSTKQVNDLLYELLPERYPKDLYKASRHLIDAGGKRVRPFLVLTCCELVGGNPLKAIPLAAAIELIHNFTLVHDDIMDQDRLRRGVPTVHVLYGVPLGINAGDMLFAKAYEAALRAQRNVKPGRLFKALDVITEATITVCEGQALDMAFEGKMKVTEREYMDMVAKKTAALLVASACVGAIAGGGKSYEVARLGRAVRASGLAFQMVDDILGLTADEKVLGKPVGSDIREGKRTLIVIHGLNHAKKLQSETILRALGNRNASLEEITKAVNTLKSLGSIDYVAAKAEAFNQRAKSELRIFPSSNACERLLTLFDYIVERKY